MILTVLYQLGPPLSENGLSISFFYYRCKNISSWAAKNCVVCRVLVCTGAWMARTMMLSKEGWEGCLDPHQLLTGASKTFIPTSSRSCDFRYSLTVTNFDEAMDALRSSTRTWGLTGFMVLLEKSKNQKIGDLIGSTLAERSSNFLHHFEGVTGLKRELMKP